MEPVWLRAASFIDVEPSSNQIDVMERFGRWLVEEAIPAGGLGPGEGDKVSSRHLADSIVFAIEFPETTRRVADLGSGVGLPGIPLAILFPDVEFTLVDRSGRRVHLAKRAIRILGLDNVEARQADASDLFGSYDVVVARAFAPAETIEKLVSPLLMPDGIAIVGGSTQRAPEYSGWRAREIPQDVLDHRAWLLMMRPE